MHSFQENVKSFTFRELQVLKFRAEFNTVIYVESVLHKILCYN